jgi:hypothetical protein
MYSPDPQRADSSPARRMLYVIRHQEHSSPITWTPAGHRMLSNKDVCETGVNWRIYSSRRETASREHYRETRYVSEGSPVTTPTGHSSQSC